MNHISKVRAGTVAISLTLLTAASFALLARGTAAPADSIAVTALTIGDQQLRISGTTTSSAESFSGYSYEIAGSRLNVKLRYTFVRTLNTSGDFDIVIRDRLNGINAIYLEGGSPDESKLLWSSADTEPGDADHRR